MHPRSQPAPHELWDIGINLGHARFARDRDQVVARAHAAGVHTLVITGTSVRASREAAALARGRDGLLATAGVHPHDARHLDDAALAELAALARAPEVRAIGECGLDFNRDFSPRPDQERAFRQQLELAASLGLPVFLHERDAHERFLAILGGLRARLPAAVVHCFTGTRAELDAYLAIDCHIGITGWICDERRGHHLAELVSRVPRDRLMLETDGPFLLPRDLRPRPADGRNEPAFLPHVLAAVARATGRPAAEVAADTTATAARFFTRG
ncbi:MAG: TatD family hydrolase [Deltaproteobacteria bacterium]|nr:TatD family hydrolase [Deltaproteobacteria bacterium]